MFSNSRIQEPGPRIAAEAEDTEGSEPADSYRNDQSPQGQSVTSVLSSDLTITGDLKTTGNIRVEGSVEGDIHAHQLTVGEHAIIRGEIVADDVVVNGRVVGRVRGLNVRLSATAWVEGDVIHKTIAIESGAHFEGSVQRQEDPLNTVDDQHLSQPKHKQSVPMQSQTAGRAITARSAF